MDDEDVKIITLARSAQARLQSSQSACLRDLDGRTYVGGEVALDHLHLSAVQVVVAMAASSGARGIEAIAVFGTAPSQKDLGVLRELSADDVTLWLSDPAGTTHNTVASTRERTDPESL